MPETTVWVRFTAERFHRWPDAPQDSLHGHLASMHRHLFHVEVAVLVDKPDRQVSFETLSADADLAFDEVPYLSTMSCEEMAATVAETLRYRYPSLARVTVSEDGENGATWSA